MRTDGVPIGEAAQTLGISKIALRKRVDRGNVEAYKGSDGRWYVVVPHDATDATPSYPTGATTPMESPTPDVFVLLQAQLQVKDEQIASLARTVEGMQREAEIMRRDHARAEQEWRVLLQTSQRLIPATIPDAPHAPERPGDSQSPVSTPPVAPGGAGREIRASQEHRGSWWRRLFGLE